MSSLLPRLLLILWCIYACPAGAAGSTAAGLIVLNDTTQALQISQDIATWMDPDGTADIAQISQTPEVFTPSPSLARQPLHSGNALWIKLSIMREANNHKQWTLNIPLPSIDNVVLYQRNAQGGWHTQSAGDTLAQTDWSHRGLYPEFDLHLPANQAQEVYLHIRNFKHLSVPLRLSNTTDRTTQRIWEIALLGMALGTLLTLTLLSVTRHVEHKSPADWHAAVYGGLVLLTVAQGNGVFNALLWTSVPRLADYASPIFPVIALGTTLLLVHALYALSTQYHRFGNVLRAIGWLTIGSCALYLVLPRIHAEQATALAMLLCASASLITTLLCWRGGSTIWHWLMLASIPQYLGMMRILAQALGWVPTLWEMRYYTSLCLASSVPILLYALHRATHDRKELRVRANHLPTQDALTGLLTREVFQTHVDEAFQRTIESREPIALVLVRIINHAHIREHFGDTIAEQSILRTVVKLHRILRDVDPAGRTDTAVFGLLLDGVTTRQALTERMVQLIASGLAPLPGMTPQITLQLHAACVLLHENPIEPEGAIDQLNELLLSMSPHTRRPIRFLEAIPTQAAALQDQGMPA